MIAEPRDDSEDENLLLAVDQALDLRRTVTDLSDPHLRELMDALLLHLGRRIAARLP